MESTYPRPRTGGFGRRVPQTDCRLCKRRQMPWKDPRCQPYEKVGIKCGHKSSRSCTPTCGKCNLRLQDDDGHIMSCANPECKPLDPAVSWLPKDDAPAANIVEATKSKLPLILRTHCRSCRIEGAVCSGSVTSLRCERCEELDLGCDCKVLRRTCAECMKERKQVIWRKCVGFHDACDYCIEKGIQCKEFVWESHGEGSEEKKSKDAVADGTMDVIDGMRATRAFAACERCLEEKVKCDESLPGCSSCAEKGVECKYQLLSAAFFEFPGRRQKRRGASLSQVQQEKSEEKDQVDIPRARISDTEALEAKSQGSRLPDNADGLEEIMNDLELEGWHLVSREEAEEAVRVSR